MAFKYARKVTTRAEPLVSELDHETAMRQGAILIRVFHFRAANDRTAGIHQDTRAVHDLVGFAGQGQANAGAAMNVRWKREMRRVQNFG
jgi:hypothetical protein